MKKALLVAFFLIKLHPCIYAQANRATKDPAKKGAGSDIAYLIIPSAENTYGYDILVKNKVVVHQLTVPGQPGNKGFIRKSDAEKVAMLVMKKVQKGMMPPTIATTELDSLKIKY